MRSSSFAYVGSYGSDIQEPGWFAHAFHGSGACTSDIEHDGMDYGATAAAANDGADTNSF